MVQFDLTLLIQAFNFIVLLAILNKIFFQPIIKIQQERKDSLETARHATEAKLKELKDLREQYETNLNQARQDAFELVNDKVAAANAERESQLSAVNAELEAKLNETKAEVDKQETELKTALEQQVPAMAALILDKLAADASKEEEVTA